VHALAVFDDGSGPALYAVGDFTLAGGMAADHVARWDGALWTPAGTGLNFDAFALAVFDDGSSGGPRLHALQNSASSATAKLFRLDGGAWTQIALLETKDRNAHVLHVHDLRDGSGPALFVGGSFFGTPAGDSYLARYQGCDVLAPVLALPDEVVVAEALGSPPGAFVNFTVGASDASDPAPVVVCTPPSGSFFPRGTTVVDCVATDAAGNAAHGQFTVTVTPKARRR